MPRLALTVRLNVPLKNANARALYAGEEIPVRRTAAGGAEVIAPRVDIHEVICFEGSDA